MEKSKKNSHSPAKESRQNRASHQQRSQSRSRPSESHRSRASRHRSRSGSRHSRGSYREDRDRSRYTSAYSTRTYTSRAREHSPRRYSSRRSQNEQVTNMLKELYQFVDFNRIRDIVERTASEMKSHNQGLLMETSSRRVREMLAEASGFPSFSSSSASEVTPTTRTSSSVSFHTPIATVSSVVSQPTVSKTTVSSVICRPTTSKTTMSSVVSKPTPSKTRTVKVKDSNNNDTSLKRPSSESLEVVVIKKKPRRPVCYMIDCGQAIPSLKKHVVGKHLSLAFATWKSMSRDKRFTSYSDSLAAVEKVLGLTTHDELLSTVLEKKWYPVDTRFTLGEEDVQIIKEYHQWLSGETLASVPSIDPPNCVAVLTHWRVFSTVINCVGEKVTLPEPTDVSAEEKVSSPKDSSMKQQEEEMEVESCNQPESGKLASSLALSEEAASSVPCSQSESGKLASSLALSEEAASSVPCSQSESGKLASSLALSEEAALLDSPVEEARSVGSSILGSPPKEEAIQDVGVPYDYATWKKRKEVFLKAKSSDRVSFIDSHMHLDKLQRASRCQDIDDILDRGPMPATPVYLQAVVANFCHELPGKKLRQMWKRDSRIFHSHGIHPKFAHTASAQDFTDVRSAIIKDPRCVGIGEFGFDYSAHFSSYKKQQITLCRKFLQLFVKEELFSKVLVIHCRDKKGSMEASETCLKIFGEELPTFDRDVMKIHHHCFNGGITQLRNWLACFPRMMFGFTALLLRQDRHPELEKVVQRLELDQILLETDSPYITAPVHSKCNYNSPYGLEEVARRVTQLKDTTVKEVLQVTSWNAKDLYGLK